MFLDIQFSEAKFFELLRDQVQRSLPVVPDEFSAQGVKVLIDHLDVGVLTFDSAPPTSVPVNGPGGATSVPGSVVRIKIPLTAHLTTRAFVLAAANMAAPAELLQFPLWVKADLSATAVNGGIALSFVPQSVGDDASLLKAAEKQSLLAKIPAINQSISLPDVAGAPLSASNAGLTRVSGVYVISAELTPPDASTIPAWTGFYAGGFAVRPDQWSIQLPKDLLVGLVNGSVTDAVDALPAKDSSIEVVQEPATAWGIPGPTCTATIHSIDACPIGASDIEIELDFAVAFALAGGGIRVTITATWDLNDWDVFRCGLATAFVPGSVATAVAGLLGPVGMIVATVATVIASVVAVVVISDQAHGKLSKGIGDVDPGNLNLQTVAQDDSHAVIQGQVAFSGLLPGMTPTSIAATADGLVVAGTLTVPPHVERSLLPAGQSPFDWDAGYSCSSSSWGVKQIDATLGVRDPAPYRLQASVDVLTVPKSAYHATFQGWGQPFAGITVTAHSNLAPNVGPDCELMLFTNSGIRHVLFKHLPAQPPQPSPQALIKAKIDCFKTALPGPQKWLEAHWLVDPPPYDRFVDRLIVWEVVVGKAAVGSTVSLVVVDAQQQTHAAAKMTVGANGRAAFRLATAKDQHIAVSADQGLEHATLFVGGGALERVARFVPFTHAAAAVVAGAGAGASVVFAAGDQVLRVGLDGKLLGSAAIPGVQHVAVVGNRLTASDGTRVVALTADAERGLRGTRSWQSTRGIAGLSAQGGQIAVALRDGTAATLDHNLNMVPATTARSTTWFAEPWLRFPIRTGNLVARVEKGAVVVYRYMRTAAF